MAEDLSKLSDAELDAKLHGKLGLSTPAPTPAPTHDFSHLSDAELDAKLDRSVGSNDLWGAVKNGVLSVGEFVDSYTGAPVRAGVDKLLRTQKEFGQPAPGIVNNIEEAAGAFAHQMGRDPSEAPTGKEIATKRLGLSDKEYLQMPGLIPGMSDPINFSPAGAAGLAMDVGLDLTNLIPAGTIAKGVGHAAEAVGKGAVKGSVAALELVTPEFLQKAGKSGADLAKRAYDDVWNPKISANFEHLQSVAAENGIDTNLLPSSVKYGPDSTISRMERAVAQRGGQRLENARELQLQTQKAFEDKLASMGGGSIPSKGEAGVALLDGYNHAVDRLFQDADTTYNSVAKSMPDARLSEDGLKKIGDKVSEIETFANAQVKRNFNPVERSQAQMLLNNIAAIRQSSGSVQQAVEELQAIGRSAFKQQNVLGVIPPDAKMTKDLYFTFRDAIYDTVGKVAGEDTLKALKNSNEMITNFNESKRWIADILGNPRLAPEQMFSQATANTKRIEALKEILTPEEFNKARSAYIDSMIKRDSDGFFGFAPLHSSLRNKKDVVNAMFSPEELKPITDLINLGNSYNLPILNTSQTDPSGMFRKVKQMITDIPAQEGFLAALKKRAELSAQKAAAPGLPLPPPAGTKFTDLFGPQVIGPMEGLGLRLPQQISIQERNKLRSKDNNK